MKTKHSKGSDGQHLLLNSGRGRGRPKKNAGRVTTIDPESDDYFKTLDKGGGPTDPLYYLDKIIFDFFSENNFARKKKEENKSEAKFEGEHGGNKYVSSFSLLTIGKWKQTRNGIKHSHD